MSLLAAAGAISGAGNAATQGLQTAQVGLTQKMLMDEREKLEALRDQRVQDFQMKLQGQQQDFQRGLQQERIGSDIAMRGQELTAKQEEAKKERDWKGQENVEDRILQAQLSGNQQDTQRDIARTNRSSQETIADLDRQNAKAISDQTLKSMEQRQTEELRVREQEGTLNRGSEDYRASLDRESREKVAGWVHEAAMQQLADARSKVQYVTDAQGRVLKTDAQGHARGYLTVKDDTGKDTPVIVGKDMDARTKALVDSMKTMITNYGDIAERVAATDPDMSQAFTQKAERMQQNLEVLLGGRAAPKGKPIVDPDAMPVAAAPSTPLPSASEVIIGTRASTGLLNSMADERYAPPKRPAKNTVSGYRRDQ